MSSPILLANQNRVIFSLGDRMGYGLWWPGDHPVGHDVPELHEAL